MVPLVSSIFDFYLIFFSDITVEFGNDINLSSMQEFCDIYF